MESFIKFHKILRIISVLFFVFIVELSSNSLVSAQTSPSPMPSYYSKITKTADNSAQLGGTVGFTVTITVGEPKQNVVIEDIFSGGGRAPDSDFVSGSATLDGSPVSNPSLFANQLNRIHYLFNIGNLSTGTHVLKYQWRISPKLGCYTSLTNEAHLDVTGVNGHLSTATVKFPVACTVCPNPNGTLKVSYSSGTHWIVGNSVLQEGSDSVYSLSQNDYAQCFCPTIGTSGTQTLWKVASGMPFWEVDKYKAAGWIYVPSGSPFDLSNEPYLAKNSSFTCTGQ